MILGLTMLARETTAQLGETAAGSIWAQWHRPIDNPVFTAGHGNNHDSILFVDPTLEYPYHLIISHWQSGADLWRSKTMSWDSSSWELVSGEYEISGHYEYDDGVKVGDTYYLFEDGHVYTYSGSLEDASGQWIDAGTFPAEDCDDIGVFYEDGIFHIFGEYGNYPLGPDGTSLSHFTSRTGLGDWQLVDAKAADPNPDGGQTYGVGDPTIIKIRDEYFIFCDLESEGRPYEIIAWKSSDINLPFQYLGVAMEPRRDQTDDWDNYRIQDPDIAYAPELSRYVMTANMMDIDGDPGGDFPLLPNDQTRVIGVFYSDYTLDTLFTDRFESGDLSHWSPASR